MDKAGHWKLAPAFDICHSYRFGSEWVSQHSLSINRKRKDITRLDLISVAKNMNIKKSEQIIDQIVEIVSKRNMYAEKVFVQDNLKVVIQKTLLNL